MSSKKSTNFMIYRDFPAINNGIAKKRLFTATSEANNTGSNAGIYSLPDVPVEITIKECKGFWNFESCKWQRMIR
jgi:hypothetical protein